MPMKTISVEVREDHLARLTHVKRPMLAVAELIWNSLDADATSVSVTFRRNALGGLDEIRVTDNGLGMPPDQALEAFGSLGGSWKRRTQRTPGQKRLMHGRAGKGRFRAFYIGETVEWVTRFVSDGGLEEYAIRGSGTHLGTFQAEDIRESSAAKTGTEVVISDITKHFKTLEGSEGAQAIAEEFAIYLRQYPSVRITYDGLRVDPRAVEKDVALLELPPLDLEDGRQAQAELTVIEWKVATERSIFLCDENGFTLERIPPGIQAPGFQFSAYLRSAFLRELDDKSLLTLEELDPALNALVTSARTALREHFRARSALAARELVEGWKKQDLYPYEGEPQNEVDLAERQMFEVVALSVHEYMPGFIESTPRQKKLSLRLLKQALAESPASLRRILGDVLELPPDKQEQLAQLLERTSLSAIINAARVVADRLDFLKGLELLVFDPETKKVLLERSQLHQILEGETWIFGEEFNLTVSDQSLTEVLRKHISILGRDGEDLIPVKREDGSVGIVDLMLSRSVPRPRADERQHLVVELKRPSVKVDSQVLFQVQSYALAVAQDERFRDTNTTWVFWAVSNEMTDEARRMARQTNRPDGLIFDAEGGRVQVWAKSWGQVIQECEARLNFVRTNLKYTADAESALAYLNRIHEEYLPSPVLMQVS